MTEEKKPITQSTTHSDRSESSSIAHSVIDSYKSASGEYYKYDPETLGSIISIAIKVADSLEEKHEVHFRYSLEPEEENNKILKFKEPIEIILDDATIEKIRRISAAFDRNKYLITIDPDNARIWGIRHFPEQRSARVEERFEDNKEGMPPGLVLAVRFKRTISCSFKNSSPFGYIKNHKLEASDQHDFKHLFQDEIRRAITSIRYSTAEFITSESPQNKEPTIIEQEILIKTNKYIDKIDYLTSEIQLLGHGATIVLLPHELSEEIPKSFHEGYAFTTPSHPCEELPNREYLDYVAHISRHDGAVLLSWNLKLLKFGVWLEGKHDSNAKYRENYSNKINGKRHQSAHRFTFDHPGCFCIVISESKTISLFYRNKNSQTVITKKIGIIEP